MEELELIRQTQLRSMFTEMFAIKKILKYYKYITESKIEDYTERSLYRSLKLRLRSIRYDISKIDVRDVLAAKETLIKDSWRDEGQFGGRRMDYFTNEDGSRISFVQFVDDKGQKVSYTEKRVKPYLCVQRIGSSDLHDWEGTQSYVGLTHWKDNFLEHIKSNGKVPLYTKTQYFRIGDIFYKWKDYFEFQGQAYERSKWGLYNNQIKDLSKALKITIDTDRGGSDIMRIHYQANLFMDVPNGEEFAKPEGQKEQPPFIKICTANARTFSDGLVSDDFFYSMFKNKNKRFWTGNSNEALCLTKEDCIGLEFSPSVQHKAILDDAINKYQKECRDRGYDKEGSAYYAGPLYNRFNKGIKFKVLYLTGEQNGKSIKAQVLQELFDCNEKYTPEELKARIKALSEILTEEAKYANSGRKKTNHI